MNEPAWTIARILQTSTDYLEGKGIESPRRNAESLLGKVLTLSRVDLYIQHDRPLTDTELSTLRNMLKRRGQHEPLQYILGEVEFYGLKLEVAPGLLVPRPETEELAERVINTVHEQFRSQPIRLLDIGAGTGCLAIAIAMKVPNAVVDAVDIDFDAYSCTERNTLRYSVNARVQPILADLFSEQFVSKVHPGYDVVISNPPYVTEADYSTLEKDVRDYEAVHALVGGPDGLKYYRRIAELLPSLSRTDGCFAFEIGMGQAQAVSDIFHPISHSIVIHSDLSGIPRIISGYLR